MRWHEPVRDIQLRPLTPAARGPGRCQGTMRCMRIGLLGPLEVRTDAGEAIEPRGARLRAVFVRLALDAGQVVPVYRLIDAGWADDPPAGAANALQAVMSRLRRSLPPGAIESHPGGYRLAVDPDAVDALRFEQLASSGRSLLTGDPGRSAVLLDEALALWRGTALADLPDAEFARAAATRLTEQRSVAIEDRAQAALDNGGGPADTAALAALVADSPIRERAVGLLMRSLAVAGRPADALAAYERLRTTVADEFGADPAPDLADLHLRILRGEFEPAEPASVVSAQTNLRPALTSFIGRDDDVRRVRKLVGENRLTTLTGPGGAGKTRLASESARTLADQFSGGVWLVQLAPLINGADIPQAILATLGLHDASIPRLRTRVPELAAAWAERLDDLAGHVEARAESVHRLAGALAAKKILIVLDNCEHLVDATASLAEHLLAECPELRILATGREPLGITGEAIWPVEPLALPRTEVDAEQASSYGAVRLFVERATASHPHFALDPTTAGDVIRICRALDGMPLAIELAAARLRTMTVAQIAARLDDRFELLTAGSRTALPRHKTLRATVEWSWSMLSDAECLMLRRLAFFTGGATADAAARVAAAGRDEADGSGATLRILTALVEKSLLLPDRCAPEERRGEPRYWMLETIKAFGQEQLAEAGETELVRRAHAELYVDLVEQAEPKLRTGEQLYWLDRLDEDHDNIHAALRSAIAAADGDTAVRLVASLGWYWNLRAQRNEGFELAVDALELPSDLPTEVRALAYANSGMCASFWPLDDDQASKWFESAVDLIARSDTTRHPMLRLAGPMISMIKDWTGGGWQVPADLVKDPDPWVRGTALIMSAYSSFYAGRDHDRATSDLDAAVDALRTTGDRAGIGMALSSVAEVASWRGRFEAAAAYCTEAIALVTELKSHEDVARHRLQLAKLRWLLDEPDQAREELAAAEKLADQTGLSEIQVMVALAAADIDRGDGKLATAEVSLDRATDLSHSLRPDSEFHILLASARGYLATAMGDLGSAADRHRSAVKMAEPGDSLTFGQVLVGVADLALARNDPARAAELLAASETVRGIRDRSHHDFDRVETAAREALGEREFTETYERGRHIISSQAARDLAAITLGV